jgi:hypothetical protein
MSLTGRERQAPHLLLLLLLLMLLLLLKLVGSCNRVPIR